MTVTLLDYTGAPNPWRAADILIFTKRTRTTMSPDSFMEIQGWPISKKMDELNYMANTIRSSWEFCDYTFLLTDVTRALTHQLVRTRHGSYAQQTQQILEIDPEAVERPNFEIQGALDGIWQRTIEEMAIGYDELLAAGATVEQARGLLPTNIHTNIVCKFNLRTLVEIFDQRISPRNLGEYRQVAVDMRQEVLNAHPWAAVFIEQSRDQYLKALDDAIELYVGPIGPKTDMHKFVDQLRRSREVRDD